MYVNNVFVGIVYDYCRDVVPLGPFARKLQNGWVTSSIIGGLGGEESTATPCCCVVGTQRQPRRETK